MALQNWWILVSMIRGGGGGLQLDFTCRLLVLEEIVTPLLSSSA